MNQVVVFYNPFLPELKISVNGKKLSPYSSLMSFQHQRLEKWSDCLFSELYREVNSDYEMFCVSNEFTCEWLEELANRNAHCISFVSQALPMDANVYERLDKLEMLGGEAAEESIIIPVVNVSNNDEMTTAVYEVLEEQGIFEDISDDGITWTDCPLVTVDIKTFDSNDELPYDAPKGAAIYANKMSEFNIVLEEIAKQQGKSVEEVKEQVDKGQMDIQKEAKKANIQMRGGRLPGEDVKIINVSSRSFGTCAYDETDQLKLFNIIIKNAEFPATGTNSFYPRQNNQRSVRFQVMECLASDEKVDPELGKEIGTAELTLPAGVTLDTEIQVTFRLDESGLLHLHAKEMKDGREVDAEFQTTEALSEQEITDAIRRSNKSSVN